MQATNLPKGVALVRVTACHKKVVVVSTRLSPDQQLAARVLACAKAKDSPFVLISMSELLDTIGDAA